MKGKLPVEGFKSFQDFYPFYLHQHSNRTCRRLHFVGSALTLVALAFFIFDPSILRFLAMPLTGYGFAWVGHFAFEKNKPATFQHPLWSLMGDWKMFYEILSGARPF